MKALVLGFEGYQGRSGNPAAAVADALDGLAEGGVQVIGVTLPVVYDGLIARIEALLDQHTPQIAVGLGLWPGEPMIRLEQLAYNRAEFEMPDNAGRIVSGEPLIEGGPVALEATLPVDRIASELLARGIPARSSQTAGTFLCNATLFALLHAAAARPGVRRCGFVHLPYLPEQVAALARAIHEDRELGLYQRADLASMHLETMVEALRTLLSTCANELQAGS